jgi:Fe-S oxidoreductase
MRLKELQSDMEGCSRCSSCKWVPFNQIKSWRFAKNCPSVTKYNFHAYSGSGKMIMANSMLQGRSELNDSIADIVYHCQLCGACDTACKAYRDDIDINEVLLELRAYCVENGYVMPEHLDVVESMKREDNTLGELKKDRGNWAEGLALKNINDEKAEVMFHAGCRFSYDPNLRDTIRGTAQLLIDAGVDIGIAGREEACCGGKAYENGFQGDGMTFADDMIRRVIASGATTLVTPCSDCFATFNYLYSRMGKEMPVKILHVSQFMENLINEGKLELKREVPMRVTYHDPCHLGRKGEPYVGDWTGKNKFERPEHEKRQGWFGIYDPPRNILNAIKGVELVEMERIREYSWCCGAGGGTYEAFPEFSLETAAERLEEALATGAEALVTSCPWCENMFREAVAETGIDLKIYDVNDLVRLSATKKEG